MATMNRNIPLSIDDDLLAEIDRVAESTKESRSAVMRRAIRDGLPLAKSGGGADVITLDSETSRDVGTACEEAKVSRMKFLIEAIRTGLQATYSKLMREKWIGVQENNEQDEEAEAMVQTFDRSALMQDPMGREVRMALRQRGAIQIRFRDTLEHVPEAWRRHQLVERLTQIRTGPGGNGTAVWGAGLSTEEIDWQIRMAEKYGVGAALPENEVKAREAARQLEDKTKRNSVSAEVGTSYPEK